MAEKRLRILCLHGSRTNADVIAMQVAGFRHAFGDSAEFVWIDAPTRATGRPQQGIIDFFGEEGPYYEWWEPFERNKFSYPGWENALSYIQKIVDTRGPFDVVLGFSQGASLATLMTAHYQANNQEIPYKAVVLVCGGCPRDGMPEKLLQEPGSTKYGLNIPSFHILGEKDEIFDLGKDLVEAYTSDSRHVHIHKEGHRFPPLPASRPLYKEYAQLLRDICSARPNNQ